MKRWAGHAAYMEETRNTCSLLIGRDSLGEQVVDGDYNIKIYLKRI